MGRERKQPEEQPVGAVEAETRLPRSRSSRRARPIEEPAEEPEVRAEPAAEAEPASEPTAEPEAGRRGAGRGDAARPRPSLPSTEKPKRRACGVQGEGREEAAGEEAAPQKKKPAARKPRAADEEAQAGERKPIVRLPKPERERGRQQGAPRRRRLRRDGQDDRGARRHVDAASGLQEGRSALAEVPRARRREPGEGGRPRPHRRDTAAVQDEELAPRGDPRGREVICEGGQR